MSTKIYEGFILEDSWNNGKIETFEKWCNEVKTIIEKIYNKEYCRKYQQYLIFCELNERYNCLKNILDFNKEENYFKTIDTIKRDIPIPEIGFFFFEGKVYGSTFLDNYGIRKILIEKGYIKDFAYWDNTDPDETVSDEEWNERQRVWDIFDHWQASIQFQDYLMRSSYYLNDEESDELRNAIKEIKQTYPKRWQENILYDAVKNDLNQSSEVSKSKINVWDIVKEIMKDDYIGKYSAEKFITQRILEDYNKKEE